MTTRLDDLFPAPDLAGTAPPPRLSADAAVREIGSILARGWRRSAGLEDRLDDSPRTLAPSVRTAPRRPESRR